MVLVMSRFLDCLSVNQYGLLITVHKMSTLSGIIIIRTSSQVLIERKKYENGFLCLLKVKFCI